MYEIRELVNMATHVQRCTRDGRWYPSRPLPPPLIARLRDAWAVLRGHADAVRWEDA